MKKKTLWCLVFLLSSLSLAPIASAEVLTCKYFNKNRCKYQLRFEDGSVNYDKEPVCFSDISKDSVGEVNILDTERRVFASKETYENAKMNLFHNFMAPIMKNGEEYSLTQLSRDKRPEWARDLSDGRGVSRTKQTNFFVSDGVVAFPLTLYTVHPTKENRNTEPVYIARTIEDDFGFASQQVTLDSYLYIKYYYCH